jgi:hypothetical protein
VSLSQEGLPPYHSFVCTEHGNLQITNDTLVVINVGVLHVSIEGPRHPPLRGQASKRIETQYPRNIMPCALSLQSTSAIPKSAIELQDLPCSRVFLSFPSADLTDFCAHPCRSVYLCPSRHPAFSKLQFLAADEEQF